MFGKHPCIQRLMQSYVMLIVKHMWHNWYELSLFGNSSAWCCTCFIFDLLLKVMDILRYLFVNTGVDFGGTQKTCPHI